MPSLLVSLLDAKTLEDRFKIIDDMNSLLNWTVSGAGATQSLDFVNFREDTAGIKMTVPASIAANIQKATGIIDLNGTGLDDHIRGWVYVDDASRISVITIQFVDNQGSPVTAGASLGVLVNGWNRFSIAKSAFSNGGTISWSTIPTIRLNVTATAAGTVNVTWDMLRLMFAPTIGYAPTEWDESNAVADVADGKIKFFDSGYWQLNDVRLAPTDFYRLDDNASGITVEMGVGYVRVSGEGGSFNTLEVINTSWDTKQALKLEEPWFYKDSAYMDDIREAQAPPPSQLLATIIDIFRQSFVKLATYELDNHENMFDTGSQEGSGLSLQERRNLLSIRFIAAFLPMNIAGMKRLVEFFVTSAVVTHNPATYSFNIQVVEPKGVPPTAALLEAAVERSKPAHLGYTIQYLFTTWGVLEGYGRTWDQSEVFTWDELEIS